MLKFIGQKLRRIWIWEPFIATPDWLEQNLTIGEGAYPGIIKISRTPHMYQIFGDIDRSVVAAIAIMSASQIGKTIIMHGSILKRIDTDPCDMLCVMPVEDHLGKYMSTKFEPLLRGCPKVAQVIQDYTLDIKKRLVEVSKKFPGGTASFVGSKQSKSWSAKLVFLDEVAEFAKGTVSLFRERMKSFAKVGGKVIAASTIVDVNDEIFKFVDMMEVKFQYWLKCPECEELFYPDDIHLKWCSEEEFCRIKGIDSIPHYMIAKEYIPHAKATAHIECPHCKAKINEAARSKIILSNQCEWVQVIRTHTDEYGMTTWERDPEPKEKYTSVGYMVNTLLAYTVPLSDFVERHIQHKDDPIELNKFYQGYYNKCYIRNTRIESHELSKLGNGLPMGVVPEGTIRLYLGIDTQKDHNWWVLCAFKYGFELHIIATGRAETDSELEELLRSPYYDLNGKAYGITKVTRDRRGIAERTDDVDFWVDKLVTEYGLTDIVYACEGEQTDRSGRKVWFMPRSVKTISGNKEVRKVMKLNTTALKNTLNNMIQRSIYKTKEKEERGKKKEKESDENAEIVENELMRGRLFYVNQDLADSIKNRVKPISTDFEMQMTAEVYGREVKNGKEANKMTWYAIRKDNHLLDCIAQAIGSAFSDELDLLMEPLNEEMAAKLIDEYVDIY